MVQKVEIGNYLVVDPEICHGQMIFKGTRVPVDTVLNFLAKGYSVDQLLRSWPELTRPALGEAIFFGYSHSTGRLPNVVNSETVIS